jgi:hypothetical protein
LVNKLIPIKHIKIEELVPVKFVKLNGKYFPIKYTKISRYVLTSFIKIKEMIVIQKILMRLIICF